MISIPHSLTVPMYWPLGQFLGGGSPYLEQLKSLLSAGSALKEPASVQPLLQGLGLDGPSGHTSSPAPLWVIVSLASRLYLGGYVADMLRSSHTLLVKENVTVGLRAQQAVEPSLQLPSNGTCSGKTRGPGGTGSWALSCAFSRSRTTFRARRAPTSSNSASGFVA